MHSQTVMMVSAFNVHSIPIQRAASVMTSAVNRSKFIVFERFVINRGRQHDISSVYTDDGQRRTNLFEAKRRRHRCGLTVLTGTRPNPPDVNSHINCKSAACRECLRGH